MLLNRISVMIATVTQFAPVLHSVSTLHLFENIAQRCCYLFHILLLQVSKHYAICYTTLGFGGGLHFSKNSLSAWFGITEIFRFLSFYQGCNETDSFTRPIKEKVVKCYDSVWLNSAGNECISHFISVCVSVLRCDFAVWLHTHTCLHTCIIAS